MRVQFFCTSLNIRTSYSHQKFDIKWPQDDKVKKTISKMVKPPKNGVRKVIFLTEVDFKKKKMVICPQL